MDYTSNFSASDRGDAPAQIVIERNSRSLAQRVVNETREELNKVMTRVKTIYGIMEAVEETYANPSMEYVSDVADLEALLQDEIKKRQYQQQVTVFIVGYQDICQQKLRLIQQVNEFFMDNSKIYDEDEWFPTSPDIDMDEVCTAVDDSLNNAHQLANKLTELNKEMMSYMFSLSEKKANNRGRKKLEKTVQQAKDDVNNLKEKLTSLQIDLQDKEEKVQTLLKQLEIKNLDCQKYKTAAELGKQKLIALQMQLEAKEKNQEEAKAKFTLFLDRQIKALNEIHEQKLEQMKLKYETKDRKLEDSNLTIKAPKSFGKSSSSKQPISSKSPSKPKVEKKSSSHTNETKSDLVSCQEERAEPTAMSERNQNQTLKSLVQGKKEQVIELSKDVFDLMDEEAWAQVSDDQGRFTQYRQMSIQRIQELEEQIQMTAAKTHRKVNSLKVQFQEHKDKWEAERLLLIQQVDQSLKFQNDAEREADTAIAQFGEYILQQERLEQEEKNIPKTDLLQATTPAETKNTIQMSKENAAPDTSQQISVASVTPESEHELQRLMQQTDDAKVQEMNTRLGMYVSTPLVVDMDSSSLQLAKSHSPIDEKKIEDKKEEELRAVSTHSQMSLRELYKAKLKEIKHASESRRTKSPGLKLTTQLTIDDELILDVDDYGDDNLSHQIAHKDPLEHNVGTSPYVGLKDTPRDTTRLPSALSQTTKSARKSFSTTASIGDHLLNEYLQVYHGVLKFKERIGNIFFEKDLMSSYHMISDLKTLAFDYSNKDMPQVEDMTRNIIHVLKELGDIIYNQLQDSDTEHLMSFTNLHSIESGSQPIEKTLGGYVSGLPPASHNSRNTSDFEASTHQTDASIQRSSSASERQMFYELQNEYDNLKQKLQSNDLIYQQQLQNNADLIGEMQQTIKELQEELCYSKKMRIEPKAAFSDKISSPSPETTVMFTRLDSERNAKIMKKAVMEEKLHPDKYKEAVSKMDEYVSLPAKRLSNLVKKYTYFVQMKENEENAQSSSRVTEDIIQTFDKVENLNYQRTCHWSDKMSGIGIERLKLANLLMDTLDTIEQESGIFLIKPMYSYRGRDIKPDHVAKLSRPVRHRHRRMAPYTDSFAPASSPNTNYHQMRRDQNFCQKQDHTQNILTEHFPTETGKYNNDGQVKVMGSNKSSNTLLPTSTWKSPMTQPLRDQQLISTPKTLELDFKRILIGQNNVSSKLECQPSDDRLINIEQNTLRSYIAFQQASTLLAADKYSLAFQKVSVPNIDKDIPVCLPSPQPLPPIMPIPGGEIKEQGVLRSSSASSHKDSHEELSRKPTGTLHVPV